MPGASASQYPGAIYPTVQASPAAHIRSQSYPIVPNRGQSWPIVVNRGQSWLFVVIRALYRGHSRVFPLPAGEPAATVLRGNAAHELVCTVPPCPRDQFHRPIRRRLLLGRGVGSPCLPDATRRSTPLILAFDARRSTFDRPYWHFTHAPRRLLAFDVRPSAFDSPDRRSTPLVAICRSPSERAQNHRKHRHL